MSQQTRHDTRRYYFISDLHIGGDETLQDVEFMDELLVFLRRLEDSDEDAELVVNGDAFGLWEFTELEGMAKFDALVERYPELFEQFRATGARIPITFIPGNHDYELACYSEYVDRLADYNVTLEQEIVITRDVGDRVIWIEHGQQRDPNNESPDFGNPYANPPGYYVNRHITSRAGKLSKRGKFNWLKDIQSVTPMTQIPDWMMSNYFYREMSPALRYAAVPFLLLFNVSLLYMFILLLDVVGVWSLPYEVVTLTLRQLNVLGSVLDFILFVNVVIVVLLTLISIPLFFLARDVQRTLERFGLVGDEDPEDVENRYIEGARTVFQAYPQVAVFIYGHTHRASITEVDDRVVVNTGTWLRRLHRKSVLIGLLPRVFYPSYRLNFVRIFEEDGSVVVEYEVIDKQNPKDLTLLERLLTRKPANSQPIPERTVVSGESHSSRPVPEDSSHDVVSSPTRPSDDRRVS